MELKIGQKYWGSFREAEVGYLRTGPLRHMVPDEREKYDLILKKDNRQ